MTRSSIVALACVALALVVVWIALNRMPRSGASSLSQDMTHRDTSGLMGPDHVSADITELLEGTYNPDDAENPIPYDIIVVGIPTAVLGTAYEPTATPPDGGYPDAEMATAVAEAFSSVYTNYLISVETVLLDDGLIESEGDLIVQMLGEHPSSSAVATQDAAANVPMNEIGQRYLFFLQESIDSPGKYLAVRESGGRLRMTGSVVTYSDGGHSPVAFATGTSPAQFVPVVASAIATMYPATPVP